MRRVILFIFSHQYLFKPVNTAVFFLIVDSVGGGGGGVNDRADFRPGCSCYWSSK